MRTLLKKLESDFGQAVTIKKFGRSDQFVVEIEAEKLVEIATWLRMQEAFRMDFLENLSLFESKGKTVFSYFLRSGSQGLQLVLRTSLATPNGGARLEIPSILGVWSHAESFESEAEKMFGVHFSGENRASSVRKNFGLGDEYPLRKSFEWGDRVEL